MRTATRWGIVVVTLALTACGSEEPQPEGPPPEATDSRAAADAVDRPHEHEDPIDARLVLVAREPGTASHRLAHALHHGAHELGEALAIAPSRSDLDPLYLVAWGHADAGLVPGNVLASSLHRAAREAVTVIGVFDASESVHVIVADASPARSIADLQGKVVSAGRVGSASHIAALDVLLASGLDAEGGEVTLEHHTPVSAIRRLGDGIDAVILTGHMGEVPGAPRTRLLPLAPEDADAVAARGYTRTADGIAVKPVLVARGAAAEVMGRIAGRPGVNLIDSPAPASNEGPPLATPMDGALRVGAGPAGGTYEVIADGIARVAERAELGAPRVVPTEGAFESFVLVATGQVDVAIVKEDLLDDALRTPAVAPLVARTRLLTPLYLEEVHVAVSAPLARLADLRGKRVSLGEVGSGSSATARRLLRLAGLRRGDISGRALGPSASIEALRGGRIDAMVFVGGQPVRAFDGSGVAFASVGPAEGYEPATLSYAWLPGPVQTVATRALLLCRRDLAPEVAEQLVAALYANRRNLTGLHPKWSELDPAALEAARRGLRLHSALEGAAGRLEPDSAAAW